MYTPSKSNQYICYPHGDICTESTAENGGIAVATVANVRLQLE